MQDSDTRNEPQRSGLSRREAIKKGAIATGLVWAAPAVTTYGRAMAQGSPAVVCVAQFNIRSNVVQATCSLIGPTGYQGNFGMCPSPTGVGGASPCSNVTGSCVPGTKNGTATNVTLEAPMGCTISQGTALQDNGACVPGVPVPGMPHRMTFTGLDIIRVRVRVECPA